MLSYRSPAHDGLKKTETLWMYQKLRPEKLNLSVSLKALKGLEKKMTTFSERALLWIVSRNPVYCSSIIQCLRENLRSEGKKQPKVVDSSAQITKIIPSTRMVV